MKNSKKGNNITSELIEKYHNKHILIVEDDVVVRFLNKILYKSDNFSINSSGYLDGTQEEGLKFVIFNK